MAIKDAIKKMEEKKEGVPKESYEPPKIFLFLSSLMLALAILAYVFEDELFNLSFSSNAFMFALIIPVFLSLFFLLCYRNKRLAMIFMGRRAELGELKDKGASVTYDVFSGSGAVEEKLMQSRRKKSRHIRKQYAQTTKSVVPEKSKITPSENKSEE